jgi:uncharacterized protein YbaP (TraB family)
MKTRILLLLAAFYTPSCVIAAGHPISMWLIEGERNRVYVLGSVHLLRKSDHPLPQAIHAAYEDAEGLVMELDMDDIDPLAVLAETNRLGLVQDERTLRDLLGTEDWDRAAAIAERMQLPLDLLMKTEPWFAAITVEQLVLLRHGFDPAYGVEMHLAEKAGADQKPITGLETVSEQLSILDGLPLNAQRDLLLQTLSDSESVQADMDQLINAWRRGDSKFLEQHMLADIQQHAELYEAIVARRNRSWVKQIVALLQDESDYLVIVGALHLIGEDGIPRLLDRQGIDTRQLHDTL